MTISYLVFSMRIALGVGDTVPMGMSFRTRAQVAPGGLVLMTISCERPSMIDEHPARAVAVAAQHRKIEAKRFFILMAPTTRLINQPQHQRRKVRSASGCVSCA